MKSTQKLQKQNIINPAVMDYSWCNWTEINCDFIMTHMLPEVNDMRFTEDEDSQGNRMPHYPNNN